MVFTCSVPNCNGNYTNGPRVTLFSFPKDNSLKKAWIYNVYRDENHKITKNSRVCERHFAEDDICKKVQAFDEKNSRIIIAKLYRFRLKRGAMPTVLLNCPKRKRCMQRKHTQTKSINGEQCDVVMDGGGDGNDGPNQKKHQKQIAKLIRKGNKTPTFTPEEGQRLLQCIQAEKKCIFYKGTFAHANRLKNNAWMRVMQTFNKDNVCKRTINMLKTQFEAMNRLTSSSVDEEAGASEDSTKTNSHTKLNYVKEENNMEEEYDLLDVEPDNTLPDDEGNSRSNSPATAADPLSGVASAYSDVGNQVITNNVLQPVTQSDIMRLKAEILQFELETAKLKQSQEKQASASEQTEKRMRAKLLALQLREARLNAWTAEQRATQAGATGDILQYRQDEWVAEDMGNEFHS